MSSSPSDNNCAVGDLARDLRTWAASELNLPNLPSQALLRDLTSTPRAAAIWSHLVSRVRAPHHAQELRDNYRLACVTPMENEFAEQCQAMRENIKLAEIEAAHLRKRLATARAQLDSEAVPNNSRPVNDICATEVAKETDAEHESSMDQSVVYSLREAYENVLFEESELLRDTRAVVEHFLAPSVEYEASGCESSSCTQSSSEYKLSSMACRSSSGQSSFENSCFDQNAARYPSSPPCRVSSQRDFVRTEVQKLLDSLGRVVEEGALDGKLIKSQILHDIEKFAVKRSLSDIVNALRCITSMQSKMTRMPLEGCGEDTGDDARGIFTENSQAESELLRELRSTQMDTFLDAESAFEEQSNAEKMLAREIRDHYGNSDHDPKLKSFLLMARLQSEKVAKSYVEQVWNSLQQDDSALTGTGKQYDEELQGLEDQVAQTASELEGMNRALERLTSDTRSFLASIEENSLEVHNAVTKAFRQRCDEARSTAEQRLSRASLVLHRINSLNVALDGKIYIEDGWADPSHFDVLRPSCQHKMELTGSSVNELPGGKFSRLHDQSSYSAEQLYIAQTQSLYARARSYLRENDDSVLRIVAFKANHTVDSYETSRAHIDKTYVPVAEEAIEETKDCVQRLIPAAHRDLVVWCDQPVRYAAPWHTRDGLTLADWEKTRQRLPSERSTRCLPNV